MTKSVIGGLEMSLRTSPQATWVPLMMSIEADKSTESVNVLASISTPISPGKPASWLALGVPISLGMPNV